MNNKKLLISIGIFAFIVTLALNFIYYKSNNRLTIYASNDSYAYKYAKRNMINAFNSSDSHTKYFNRVWEDFKFNEESNGLVITKYEGVSEELIVPTTYNDYKIIKIEKGALPSTVKKIFLPDSVKEIEESDFKNIEVLCYKGKYCDDLKNNKDLKVTVLDDVDRYILNEEDLEFTYNLDNNEIELTNYIGKDENVVIPKTINGYKVTSINFDGDGITSIFIPDTVNSISGNITSKLFNKCLISCIIIVLISLVVFCISTLLIKINELIDVVYVYSTSIIYIGVVNYLLYLMRNNPYESKKYILYSIIVCFIYLIVNFVLGIIIKNNKKFNKYIKHKNDFIKEINLLLKDYDFDELNELVELIKYSDPVSIDEVKDIEDNIINEIKDITKDNINDKVKVIKKLITKRNTLIKDNK